MVLGRRSLDILPGDSRNDVPRHRAIAQDGDWIIKGPQGDFWPCKSDIFEDSYEEVWEDARA